MSDIDQSLGDLSPRQGISNYTITVAGLDNEEHGKVAVRFRIEEMSNRRFGINGLSFTVPPGPDGLEGAIGRAHDELILALRQMLYHAAVMRKGYKQRSAQLNPSGSSSANAA